MWDKADPLAPSAPWAPSEERGIGITSNRAIEGEENIPFEPPFLGASAPWMDPEEVDFNSTQRDIAQQLRDRLRSRIKAISLLDNSADDLLVEIKRQMAEAAVNGNFIDIEDLGAMVWKLVGSKGS